MKPLFKFLAKTLAAFLAASFLVAAPTAVPTSASADAIISQLGIDIDGEAADDLSGRSVSLSSDGTRVAIGAYGNDGNGDGSGHVRVYEFSGGAWRQLGGDINGEAAGDQSGRSVSLSSDGTRVAIGAVYNDGNGDLSGHVRIYDYNGTTWVQLGSDIDGEAAGDKAGWSVSLSSDGTRVAIGAYDNDENGVQSGHVRVYELIGGRWTQLGSDIDGEAAGDRSGYTVSLSSDGTRVAIGANRNNGNVENSGHVRIYDYNGTTWVQLGSDIDGEAADDYSGISVSLSSDGTRVAIGAANNDGNGDLSGHVRVYELIGGSWTQLGSDIDGEAAGDRAGWYVSLSSDGTRVAISAYANDENGVDSGHVRVYVLSDGSWTQLGSDIDGEAAGDYSGWSVSLSNDGTRVAIGALFNDGNGNNSGHVRLYSITTQAAPAPAPAAPQAYRGPAPSGISTKIAFEGDSITVIGRRLDLVGSLEIDGVAASITSKASKALVFTMPSSLSPGIKQLVMKSSHGILTYYPGLQLVEKAPAPVTDASASEVVEEFIRDNSSSQVVEQLGKVNAGSFNGYIAVYAKGHKGKTLSWKIAGKWFKTTVTSDYQVFRRRTAAVGLNVDVHLHIDGKKQLTKTVKTS